jgi:hypothetical protein
MGRPWDNAGAGPIFLYYNPFKMSIINKGLMGFLFSGSPLALASASFKANLNSISGFNAAGTGYTSFRPGNTFNSLTELKQDGSYIVDAKTTGFDIPGAVLTSVTGLGAGPLSATCTMGHDSGGNDIAVVVTSTDTADRNFIISVLDPDTGLTDISPVVLDYNTHSASASFGYDPGLGKTYTIKIVNRLGNIITKQLTS